MPVHVNSIGEAVFFDLIGALSPKQETLEIIERPGVDGCGARRMGTRGKPIEFLSISYHTSFTTALEFLQASKTLVGDDPQTVIRNDVTLGTFLVLSVEEATPAYAVVNVAGSPGSECRLEMKWTLYAMS